ncbi:MAG: hypothetical protein ACJ8DI_06510 [Ktedonobacteraceae bacterium]
MDPVSVRLRLTVHLVYQSNIPPTIAQHGTSFVALATPGDTTDYQVAIAAAGTYEIWDSTDVPIADLRPVLYIDNSYAADQVAQKLVHLTKYRNIQQPDNTDIFSPVAGKLVVEFAGWQAEYDTMDRPEPRPFDDTGNILLLRLGEWIFLHVKNLSSRVLNVTVLVQHS